MDGKIKKTIFTFLEGEDSGNPAVCQLSWTFSTLIGHALECNDWFFKWRNTTNNKGESYQHPPFILRDQLQRKV